MLSASQSLHSIVADMKAMKAHEGNEAALSTNRPWVSATKQKIKRDAPTHTPLESDAPETFFTLTERTLHGVASVIKARRVQMERGIALANSPEWEARRRAALTEVDVPPIEAAFLYGYTTDKSLRELRIRHGLDPNTGRPLRDSQRPIISDRKRARR